METTAGKFLKQQLSTRQRKNRHYSMRAFARDLGMHPGTLSAVMKGQRDLPPSALDGIALNLGLSPRKLRQLSKTAWLNAPAASTTSALIEETNNLGFELLSEWEHYAVMSLTNTKDFISTSDFIASRLGISELRAEVVVQNLVAAGLLEESEGKLRPTTSTLSTPEDVASIAIRKAHLEELDIAKEKLTNVSIDCRDFSSVTFASSGEKIPAIKQMMRRFRDELVDFAEGDACDNNQVFQMCLQFFPLSQINDEERNEVN